MVVRFISILMCVPALLVVLVGSAQALTIVPVAKTCEYRGMPFTAATDGTDASTWYTAVTNSRNSVLFALPNGAVTLSKSLSNHQRSKTLDLLGYVIASNLKYSESDIRGVMVAIGFPQNVTEQKADKAFMNCWLGTS
ncbi:MAG: hypothetical protein ACPG5U_10890 [Planktomarina sp.]